MLLMPSRFCRRLVLGALAAAAIPCLASTPPLRLELALDDVDAVFFAPGGAVLRLRPEAAKRLRLLTREHIGSVLELLIDSLPAVSVRVHAEIDSGIVQLPEPSPALRQRLQAKTVLAPAR